MKIILESKKLRKELNKVNKQNEKLRERLYNIESYINKFSAKHIDTKFSYWDSVQLTLDISDLCNTNIYEIYEEDEDEE